MNKISVNNLIGLFALILFIGIMTAFMSPQTQKKGAKWVIPQKYVKMKNPYVGNKRDMKMGRMLYSKYCKSCHGSKGLGDGPKAAKLKTLPGDFSTAKFQAYTDGELYYMTAVGREEMKGYNKKIPDEENIWALVSYMRTMKK